jgi:antitoxin component YwqK of YwqJK toxin-antitoxin module
MLLFLKIPGMEKYLKIILINRTFFTCLILMIAVLLSCQSGRVPDKHRITVNISMLDSIRKVSDSIYTKPYYTRDFATAEYFMNKKDSILTQVMKDKDSVIRQVIITKNKLRIFTAQYYANGQLTAKYELDKFGQYDGYSEEFYEDGSVKRSGNYKSGFHTGEWKNYAENGKLSNTETYNESGQAVSSKRN